MDITSMINSVKVYLIRFGNLGKKEKDIFRAMEKIDRKDFMLKGFEKQAYVDMAMPIGCDQTISQPSTVARMLQLLDLKDRESVLEIGTGSGWNAGLIGFLVGKKGRILSLEIYKKLIDRAEENLWKYKLKNIKIEKRYFRKIKKKFDKIMFTAGILPREESLIEEFALSHLKQGGLLICPYQAGPLIIMKKKKGKIMKEYTEDEYIFVPLVL